MRGPHPPPHVSSDVPRELQPRQPAVIPQLSVVSAFRTYLRAELRARRWSIRSLAARSGVDHSTIVRLLRGYREPRLETVAKLQRALGVTGQELLMGTVDAAAQNDPVQRVVDALRSDPKLDRQGMATVVAYYLKVRRPPALPGPATRRSQPLSPRMPRRSSASRGRA